MGPTEWRKQSTIAFSDRSVPFSTDSRLDSIRSDYRLMQRWGRCATSRSSLQDAGPAGGSRTRRRSHKADFLGSVRRERRSTAPFSGASPASGEGTVPAHFETEFRPRRFQLKTLLMCTFDRDATPKREDGPAVSDGSIAEQYRLFYVSSSDKFQGVQMYVGASDAEALERARSVLKHHPYAAAIEVWKRSVLLGRIDR